MSWLAGPDACLRIRRVGVFGMIIATALIACSGGAGHAPSDGSIRPSENCKVAGDEDGNGLADCLDPACADAPACRPACGNGILDPGEACDDGNTVSGDGCQADCTLPRCGNGILEPREACDDGNTVSGDGCEADCTLPRCGNGIADPGEACDDGNTVDGDGCQADCTLTITYTKAFNTGANDQFGWSTALSADGLTLAVGAPLEDSKARGLDDDEDNEDAPDAGAVYIYRWSGTAWQPQAYVKPSNTHAGEQFGMSLALSANGTTLVVGAGGEASAATGVDSDQFDRSAPQAGAVFVFTYAVGTWHQDAYLKASNTDAADQFGTSVAVSADGATVAVGAPGEASAAPGVDGDQGDNSRSSAGAVYVFTRTDGAWSQQAYVKASNPGASDTFGWNVALSGDGATLAASAPNESSAAVGIDGDQGDNSAVDAGAVYVFTRAGGTWSQQAYVKASNSGRNDLFGSGLALAGDGATLAVGAYGEDSAATGVDGDQTSNSLLESGAAYVFRRAGTTWQQEAYLKASNTGLTDQFGWSLALSPDGVRLAVGAVSEESGATGIGGDQADNSAFASGAIYLFQHSGSSWYQEAYLKASNTGVADQLGWSVSLAGDSTVAAGAPGESSAACNVGGNQLDNSASGAGAVYVFR